MYEHFYSVSHLVVMWLLLFIARTNVAKLHHTDQSYIKFDMNVCNYEMA